MGREKDRKLRRRQRRVRKLRKLKDRLAQAKPGEREFLVEKIKRISTNPKRDIPEEYLHLLEN